METMRCPYCECKVLMSDVEDDDGLCPECGAPLLSALNDGFADDQGDDEDDMDLDADASAADDDEDDDLDEDDIDDED